MATNDIEKHRGHKVEDITGLADDHRVYLCIDCDLQFHGERIRLTLEEVAKVWELPTGALRW